MGSFETLQDEVSRLVVREHTHKIRGLFRQLKWLDRATTLELEQLLNEELCTYIDTAIMVGIRYGRTRRDLYGDKETETEGRETFETENDRAGDRLEYLRDSPGTGLDAGRTRGGRRSG